MKKKTRITKITQSLYYTYLHFLELGKRSGIKEIGISSGNGLLCLTRRGTISFSRAALVRVLRNGVFEWSRVVSLTSTDFPPVTEGSRQTTSSSSLSSITRLGPASVKDKKKKSKII